MYDNDEEVEIYPEFIHTCGGQLYEHGIATNPLGYAWIVYLCDMSKGGCGRLVNGPQSDAGPDEYWSWCRDNDEIKIIGEVKVKYKV